jgi:Ras-related protein Rab-6A
MEDDGVPVEDLLKLKLIVVGNQSTGKSCILNRFVNETFEENYQATIGLDFQSKNITIHDQDIRLILYDTAGQEKFRSLIPMYIREAQIILLIYDISDKESFDSMPKWIKQVEDVKISEAVFVLIGNKIDLENERKVTYEEGKKFAEENNFIFQEVSAKTGKNFETLFEVQIYEAIYNKFKSEFDKREKIGLEDDHPNYETNEYTNKNNDNKVKLEANTNRNNSKNVKKKKKCC